MAGIYSQGGSAGHRYAGWLSEVEAKNFQFGGKVFNGSPSAIYVGSNLVWMGGWLSQAAQQAILGAFGQRDGMAVINATNAYLNQLAASGQAGKDKATALAGFINEDPMMVCSLGLVVEGVTMPIRWLVGDGTAKIYTGIISYERIELDVVLTTSLVGNNIFGYNYNKSGTQCRKSFGFNNSSLPTFGIGDGGSAYIQQSGGWSLNTLYHIEAEFLSNGSAKLWQNGTLKYSGSAARNNDIECCLMGLNQNNGLGSGGMVGKGNGGKFYTSNEEVANFIPFKRNDAMEYIDLETGTLATRVGTFTELFTLQDGVTPWTPPTP